MVLVHKLKQMEELDIEQLNQEDARSHPLPYRKDYKEQTDTEENQHMKRAPSPPRRPLTRSQTGISKRKQRDESPIQLCRKFSLDRKKPKGNRKFVVEATYGVVEEKKYKPPESQPDVSEVSTAPESPPLNSSQLTFLEGSSSVHIPVDRRGPRSRVILPIPVPNLTKKSRGRRVPTRLVVDRSEDTETRVYVCKVESCGKCFHRGEHLKRHIRSIHTHEKPFKCSHPSCEKHFNRHDNLLQHLKVHKEVTEPRSSTPEDGQLQTQQKMQPLKPYSLINDPYEVIMHRSGMDTFHQPASFMRYTTITPYGSTSELPNFATNMAVSSLRTELPRSPTPPRAHETFAPTSQQLV